MIEVARTELTDKLFNVILVRVGTLRLSFSFGIIGGDANVATWNERRNFDSSQSASDHLPVSTALEAEDGCSEVRSGENKVHVEVVLSVEGERLWALLWSGPEKLSTAGQLI